MILSELAIYTTALGAHFLPADALTMTAIALAESGGETTAHNPVPPDDSYGLWQINMLNNAAAKRRDFGIRSNVDLFEPQVNGHAAQVIYGWQGFNAWSTWLDRAYVKFLPRARDAADEYAHAHSTPIIARVLRYRLGAPLTVGPDVQRVQALVGVWSDAVYGPLTAAAVRRWQRAHHLQADGVWGPESTRAAGWRWLG